MKKHSLLLLLLLLLVTGSCEEEPEEPDPQRRKSPIAIASINHNQTYVKIVYGQPYKNGRKIFGGLEPYGEVWRTGANEATEITTNRDILFAGNELDAGTYSLFTIPRPDEWTIILNSGLGQWGAFDYTQELDVMRVDVPADTTDEVTEAFTIRFGEIVNDSTSIILEWDRTEVHVPLEFLPASNNAE